MGSAWKARYQARFRGTKFRRVAVTNQAFTRAAVTQAEANQVELVTRSRLEELIGAHPVSNHEFDEVWHELTQFSTDVV
ncbi:protein of unknown function [Cupriavidus taiwanensis]|nr:protein of unknown function [Cupriavidus taiwanensis]